MCARVHVRVEGLLCVHVSICICRPTIYYIYICIHTYKYVVAGLYFHKTCDGGAADGAMGGGGGGRRRLVAAGAAW